MIRAVVDSNVFVSGLNFGGVPGQVLDRMVVGEFTLCISEPLLDELKRILRERFDWTGKELAEALDPLVDLAELVHPARTIAVTDDPDDNSLQYLSVEKWTHEVC